MKMSLKQEIWSIDELNAYREAYGNPLMKKEIFTILVVPFMVCFFAVYVLTYYWWLSLIGGIVGVAYGYIVMMRINVERVYQQEAINQRNRFVNTMTAMLSNLGEPVIKALKWCSDEGIAKGEFKKDIDQLISVLMDSGPQEVKAAFTSLKEKYKRDFVFGQYIENLIIITLEGRNNIDKLKELASWHNDVLEVRNEFIQRKVGYKKEFIRTTMYPLIIVGVLTFIDFDQYIRYYAHNYVGWIASAILLFALASFFHSLQKKLADDEVMEVKMWKK